MRIKNPEAAEGLEFGGAHSECGSVTLIVALKCLPPLPDSKGQEGRTRTLLNPEWEVHCLVYKRNSISSD